LPAWLTFGLKVHSFCSSSRLMFSAIYMYWALLFCDSFSISLSFLVHRIFLARAMPPSGSALTRRRRWFELVYGKGMTSSLTTSYSS